MPVIFLYQKTTFSHEVNHVQVFVWVRFFEARVVGFRRSQIESCKKKKKTSSYEFLVIRANTRVADQQPFSQAFIPRTYLCLLICLHQHTAPHPPSPRQGLSDVRRQKCSIADKISTDIMLWRAFRTFNHFLSMQCCAAVRATCRKQQAPQLWMEGRGGLWIEKNFLNAEVHTTLKYNWLVPLAGSLIKEMLWPDFT